MVWRAGDARDAVVVLSGRQVVKVSQADAGAYDSCFVDDTNQTHIRFWPCRRNGTPRGLSQLRLT